MGEAGSRLFESLLDKSRNWCYTISSLADTKLVWVLEMDRIEKLAGIFKALSDPTRLRLIHLLSECSTDDCREALCVKALAGKLGVSQSAVSQHLRVLRQAGLVHGDRRGYHVHYSLDPERLEQYKASIRETLGEEFVVVG